MWTELGTAIGVPVIQALPGWAQQCLSDGMLDWPDVKKLVETVLRVGVPSLFAYYGIGALGFDANAATMLGIVCLGSVADMIANRVRKHNLALAEAGKKR